MRRTNRLAAVAIALGFVLSVSAGMPAQAVEPVTPVAPIPDLPSNTVRMAPGANGSWSVVDIWKAQWWYANQPGKELATISNGSKAVVAPKPITAPAQFARGAGTAGASVFTAFSGGWALGATGGLELYGAITGNDAGALRCNAGDWYQAATSFLTLGLVGDDCSAEVVNPLTGELVTGGDLTYGTFRMTFVKAIKGNHFHSGQGQVNHTTYCWTRNLNGFPSGATWSYAGMTGALQDASHASSCATVALGYDFSMTFFEHLAANAPTIRLRNSQGVLLAETSPVSVTPQAQAPRKPLCTITWTDGTVTSGYGTTYTESMGLPTTSSGLGCKTPWEAKPGAGREVMPDRITVDSEDAGGSNTRIADSDVPPMTEPQKTALDPKKGNGRGLVLEKVVNDQRLSCMTWEVDCSNWWDATNEGTQTPTPYKCSYAGNSVALVECGPYRHTFDEQTASPTITDPVTGEPVPWSGVGTNPGTINDTVTGGGACGAGWSWNPVDWVVNPVKCLTIPSKASVDQTYATITDRWEDTGVGALSAAVSSWAFIAPSSGCDGINVPLSVLGHGIQDFRILNACPGSPLQSYATLSTLVIGIAAVLGCIYAVTGSIGGIVGARPVAAGGGS